ncbi:FDLD family class I lanthipeptide [Paenibacillus jamilae]|uniref:FDLD family class I lanthipeptide n=1 Tax=Paenibacillus jamilae TaxID=114136 RepID=UPI003D26D826
MANDAFDLDVQVNKSKGSVEPQVFTSIAACSAAACGGERTEHCGKTQGNCISNIGNWC